RAQSNDAGGGDILVSLAAVGPRADSGPAVLLLLVRLVLLCNMAAHVLARGTARNRRASRRICNVAVAIRWSGVPGRGIRRRAHLPTQDRILRLSILRAAALRRDTNRQR